LLKNGGFELDADSNGAPDNWSLNAKFTRSNEVAHSGSFAGKFFATDNRGATITQTVGNITAGTTYNFSGWTNIPATADAFTFTLQVRWLDAARAVLRTDTLKAYTDDTAGAWDEATGAVVAPEGVDKAQVVMVVKNLNATIYVDDVKFNP
jgi:hypothetical protein